jgi:hypothetical protein
MGSRQSVAFQQRFDHLDTIQGSNRLYFLSEKSKLEISRSPKVMLMPMLSRLDDPHFCLARAREARRRAEATQDGGAKGSFLALANDYLKLAKFALNRRKDDLAAHRLQQ